MAIYKKKSYWDRVYEITRSIPEGRVSTYGAIANYLSLGSARMVGWALNHCHEVEDYVPAHRVVNRKGELSGRMQFSTATAMEEALIVEGVQVEKDRVVSFKTVFWDPIELG